MFDYKRVILIRESLKLSETKFAQLIGVPQKTYNRIEKGLSKIDAESIAKVVEVFNVNVNWLLTGEGEMFSAPTVKVEKDQYDQLLKENYQMAQELAELRKKEIEALKAENTKLKSQAERLKNNP